MIYSMGFDAFLEIITDVFRTQFLCNLLFDDVFIRFSRSRK
jgi:hypothetical protein